MKVDIEAAVDDVEVILECTPTVEGWLEVVAAEGGKSKLLHSKKYGMGFVDTPAKTKRIIDDLMAMGAVLKQLA